MSKRKKPKRRPKWLQTSGKRALSKSRTQEAREEEDSIRQTLKLHGIDLAVSEIRCGNSKRTVPHWRFLQGSFVLLHYWPSSKKYRTADGATGVLPDPHAAGLMARYLVGEADADDLAELRRFAVEV